MTIEVGKPMPLYCHACQAIPRAGYCNLAGCPLAPAENDLSGRTGSGAYTAEGKDELDEPLPLPHEETGHG